MNTTILRLSALALPILVGSVGIGQSRTVNASPPPKLRIEAAAIDDVLAIDGPLVIGAERILVEAEAAPAFDDVMLQRLLKRELDFVRQVCDLQPEQRPRLRSRTDAIIMEVTKSVTRPGASNGMRTREVLSTMRDHLAREIKLLSPDQARIYTQEVESRDVMLKQATILDISSRVDAALCLTREQRESIVAGLTSNWVASWERWLAMPRDDDDETMMPNFVDKFVAKTLTPAQKKLWKALPKVDLDSLDQAWLDVEFEVPLGAGEVGDDERGEGERGDGALSDDDWWSGRK